MDYHSVMRLIVLVKLEYQLINYGGRRHSAHWNNSISVMIQCHERWLKLIL